MMKLGSKCLNESTAIINLVKNYKDEIVDATLAKLTMYHAFAS